MLNVDMSIDSTTTNSYTKIIDNLSRKQMYICTTSIKIHQKNPKNCNIFSHCRRLIIVKVKSVEVKKRRRRTEKPPTFHQTNTRIIHQTVKLNNSCIQIRLESSGISSIRSAHVHYSKLNDVCSDDGAFGRKNTHIKWRKIFLFVNRLLIMVEWQQLINFPIVIPFPSDLWDS